MATVTVIPPAKSSVILQTGAQTGITTTTGTTLGYTALSLAYAVVTIGVGSAGSAYTYTVALNGTPILTGSGAGGGNASIIVQNLYLPQNTTITYTSSATQTITIAAVSFGNS